VVTPLLFGLEDYEALPHASSLCGACKDVCPVRIDLPRMLLELRTDEVTEGVAPWRERKVEEAGAFVLGHEKLMRFMTGAVRLAQRPFVRDGALNLPSRLNPVLERQLPALAKRSFRDMWKSGELEEKR
jgi:L-lactate dehydrogenase complex protein LldF